MKLLSLVLVLFLNAVVGKKIEIPTEDFNQSIGRSGRGLVDPTKTCSPVSVPAKVYCADSNPCLTGKKTASLLSCTTALGSQIVCKAPTPYCYEPNPQTPGKASCTATRNFGCDAIDARECDAAPGKKFCLNNSPCVTANSIRQCNADINVKTSTLVTDCTAAGFIGCMDNTNGDPKCIKQAPWYCPNAVPYVCTGEGFYPNAFNCRQYFKCIEAGSMPPSKECPTGQVFDPMSNKNGNPCKVNNGNNCVESTCPAGVGGGNMMLEYPGFARSSGSYAVACGGQQPKVYRCEDGFEPNLAANPINCTGKCPGNGNRAIDPANPRGYYTCSYNGIKYTGSHNICEVTPNTLGIFSKVKKICQ